MLTFTADRGDAKLRLDQVVMRHLADLPRVSRARVQRWIDEHKVLVNGRPARRAASPVAPGDSVEIQVDDESVTRRARPEAEDIAVDVLYEDDHLIAVNKPAGMVAHPSYRNTSGTLLNAILGRIEAGGQAMLVQRLDKDTSGVLLAARSRAAHAGMQRAMQLRTSEKTSEETSEETVPGGVLKEYLAVVNGLPKPDRGSIALPLGRDPGDRRRMTVTDDGQASETQYEVLDHAAGQSLLKCRLITGRTHQIRVHLSARGWPVAGDAVYGQPSEHIARQALHAWHLAFTHPLTGAAIDITAPIPEDFKKLMVVSGLWSLVQDQRPKTKDQRPQNFRL